MESPRDELPTSPEWMARLERIHPHQMLLSLAMIGSALIFGYLMVGYGFSQARLPASAVALPKPFIVSTLVIVFSSFWLVQARRAFSEALFADLRRNLTYVLLLGLLFAGLQAWGWWDLLHTSDTNKGSFTAKGYLYLMSGLHFLHLFGGLIFLAVVRSGVGRAAKDPVKSLITVTTPYRQVQINMLVSFWHYLDAVWVVLFVYFLFLL